MTFLIVLIVRDIKIRALKSEALKSIKALYKKELRCDDTVTIKLNQNDENTYVCTIYKNETLCFEAEMTFF